METDNARIQDFARKLAAHGYRLTHQRLCILEALLTADNHPTAGEIYTRVRQLCPRTSLGTIYRTLETFKEIGEVRELQFRDGSNRYDGIHPRAHPHVICTHCGHIEDLTLENLYALEAQASQASGYQIRDSRVEFYGLCKNCQ
ncbi:MAG TPA: Fur family transcriptional regulator [Chthonomonadaceae bacterium]|nr:Fur family transcriptional regulator [Chthonomonadaceae bacterium]